MEDIRKGTFHIQGEDIDIEPVAVYDGRYYLYDMTMKRNYDVYDVISHFTDQKEKYKSGGASVDIEASNAVKKALGMTTNKNINFDLFGCTAFSAKSSEKIVYMGRNYDYATNTSCVLVRCNPRQTENGVKKYKSIACAASSSLTMEQLANDDEDIFKFLPFACLDGINEAGVSIAVLVVDTKTDVGATYQDRDGDNIFTTLAIRLVLDCAATTNEAVDLLKKYNMFANGSKDYHFFISDATCDSRVVEYNYKKKTMRDLTVTGTKAATNFYVFDKETFGHGHGRYKTVMNNLKIEKLSRDDLWRTLKDTSQTYEEGNTTSNTQWSILFDNTNQSAEIAIHQHFNKNQRKTFYISKK